MKDTELSAELQALLPDFIAETRDYLEGADKALETLKHAPNDTEAQKALFRLFHTIKGTCRFFNLIRLEKLVHVAEGVISSAQKQTQGLSPETLTVMRDAVDRVLFIIDTVEHPNISGPKDDEDLIARLKALLPPESGSNSHSQISHSRLELHPSPPTPQNSKKATPPESSTAHKSIKNRMVRIPEYILDQLMALSSELVPTYSQIEAWARDSKSSLVHNVAHRLSLITSDLQDTVLKARLQPIRVGWRDLPEKIAALATELHKKIVLEIEDHSLKLDRHIIETLKGPLTHIIRNALDHGIEPPEERIKAHKPEHGTLRLSARQEGAYVIVTIYDDGRGLNIPHVREKAAELLLYDKETLNAMSDEAVALLLFTPGFSTAQTLTEISGRGVGLDAARDYITALGGNITLSSEPGKSTTVTIILPLTFATTKMLIVRVRDFIFALPQNGIRELFLLPQAHDSKTGAVPEIAWAVDHPFVRWENHFLPIVSLAPFLKLQNTGPEKWGSVTLIVISPPGYVPFCLLVGQALHTEELLIKALPKFLRLPPVFSGQSLLGDGSPILVLDAATIAQLSSIKGLAGSLEHNPKPLAPARPQPLLGIYLNNQKGSDPKLLPLASVLRIETFTPTQIQWVNGHPFISYHGEALPLVILKEYPFSHEDRSQYPLILITDGTRVGALPVHKVHGLVSPDTLERKNESPHMVSGDKIWDLLDITKLLLPLPQTDISIENLGLPLPTQEKH